MKSYDLSNNKMHDLLSGQEKTYAVQTVLIHVDSGARFAGFQSWLCHLLALQVWPGDVTSLCLLRNFASSL